jgi:hypothetical protein
LNKVDPLHSARNLFAKDCCRSSLLDKPQPGRPKVPLVSKPRLAACRGERLAWAASGPNRPVIRPTSKTQGVAPSADAGEKVALIIARKVSGGNVKDGTLVNVAGRNEIGMY